MPLIDNVRRPAANPTAAMVEPAKLTAWPTQQPQKFARGRVPNALINGIVRGEGGPTEDKVPAKVSPDEAILPAKTVQALGGPAAIKALIERTNDGQPPESEVQGGGKYADGAVPGFLADWQDAMERDAPIKQDVAHLSKLGEDAVGYARRPVDAFADQVTRSAHQIAGASRQAIGDFEGKARLMPDVPAEDAAAYAAQPSSKPLTAGIAKTPETPTTTPAVTSLAAAARRPSDPLQSAAPQSGGKQTTVPGVMRYDEPGKTPLFSNVGTGAPTPVSPRAGTPLVSGLQGGNDVMGILQRESQIRNEMTPLRDQIAFNAGTGGLPLIRQRGNDEALRDMLFSDNVRAKDAVLRYMGSREEAAEKQSSSLRDEAFRQRELDAKLGMADREFGLKSDEQGMKMDALRQKQDLQKQFMTEQDPAKRKEIARQLAVIDGQYGSLDSHELAKARMGLIGEAAKAYNGPMGVPLGPDKMPMPFDQYVAPILRAAGAGGSQPAQQQTPGTVSTGQVINGYRFKGGDPSKQASWEKA